MDAAGLISTLVDLERAAGKFGDGLMRDLVIEAQDWVLRTQKENLDLRRENQVLRRRYGLQDSESGQRGEPAAMPFHFHAIAQSKRLRGNGAGSPSSVGFARAM